MGGNRRKKNMAPQSQRFDPYKQKQKTVSAAADKVDLVTDVADLAVQKHGLYDEMMGCLRLTRMGELEELQKHSPNLNTETWCLVVANLVKRRDGCKALYLDHNKIRSVDWLVKTLQGPLEFLSLEGNELSNVEDIQRLQPLKLRHLILRDNPMLAKAGQERVLEKVKKLPTLRCIDSAVLERSSVLDELPVVWGLLDNTDKTHIFVYEFISKYYELSMEASGKGGKVDRLLDLYHSDAVFSYTTTPNRLSMAMSGAGLAYGQKLNSGGHNILHNQKLTSTVHTGKLAVGQSLQSLHLTKLSYDAESLKHADVSIASDAVLQDSGSALTNMLTVTMHSTITFEFERAGAQGKKQHSFSDAPSQFKKFFDRTWVLTMTGGQALIVNDMLHIRDVKNEPLPCLLSKRNEKFYSVDLCRQHELMSEVCGRTGINPDMAKKALEVPEVKWDAQKAVEMIQTMQNNGALGADLFAPEWADVERVKRFLIQSVTRLTDNLAGLLLQEVQYSLWFAWQLFQQKDAAGALSPECFLQD